MGSVSASSTVNKYALADVYPGTQPFRREQEDRFFGRDSERSDLKNLVLAYPVVLLYAESGTGKSSLVNAGLIPALGAENCHVSRVSGPPRKGEEPENVFVFNSLLNLAGENPDLARWRTATFLDWFSGRSPKSIDEESSPNNALTFLIFDQFEELLTTHPERWEDRPKFFQQLRAVLNKDPRLHVLFVAREEHLAGLEKFEQELPDGFRIRYYLERLTALQARDAILKPAMLAGLERNKAIEESVDRLISDLQKNSVEVDGVPKEIKGEFVEPLHLQIICQQLARSNFQPDQAGGATLSVDDALVRYYDESVSVAAKAGHVGEMRVRDFLERYLVTATKTRGLIYRNTARGYTKGISNRVLESLEQQRIVHEEQRNGATWYELTHDRLIQPIMISNAQRRKRRWTVVLLIALVVAIAAVVLTLSLRPSVNRFANAYAELEREAKAQPATAVVLGLSNWRGGDRESARPYFKVGRERAPMQSIQIIDDAIREAQRQNDPALKDLKAARIEFLRYPIIGEEMKNQPDLRDYMCAHNFVVIAASGSKAMAGRFLARYRSKFPNAEIGSPNANNPQVWAVFLDAFLTCDEAEKLALRLYESDKLKSLISHWYDCPHPWCRTPAYGETTAPAVTSQP